MDINTLDKAQVPGLVVFRLAPEHKPNNPHRWRISHTTSGLAVADSLTREQALAGAELLGTLTDWTQGADTVKAALSPSDVYAQLSYKGCVAPGSQPCTPGTNVSNNGSYTDVDIEEAAAAAKAEGLNALNILALMSETVPWCGLDMEDFIEAHNRIVQLADAA